LPHGRLCLALLPSCGTVVTDVFVWRVLLPACWLCTQIMRNTLYKAYLDDFAAFCEKLGGTTAEVMSDLLAFEADRRALNITLNRCAAAQHWAACAGWPCD
jgi:hypothetical protein